MKIYFFQIFKSSVSQPFLSMALSFSTLSNQYCFIISLKSTFLWFSRNPLHSVIVVLRSKQILFLHLMTTVFHKITHNKVCIALPCFRGFGWPRNPSPAKTPVPNLRSPVVSFQLLGLPAKAVVRKRKKKKNKASPTTLHAVPNQHLHLFPIFYTLWSPPTILNTLLKLLQLNLYWEGPVMQVHSNTCRPLFGLTKAFHVGGSTLWKLSHHAESSTTFNYFT